MPRSRRAWTRCSSICFQCRHGGSAFSTKRRPYLLERYDLEGIHVPTLILSTVDDRYGTYDAARYTAEHIHGARFIGYATGGHLLVGHNNDVFAEIVAFLKR